MRWPWSKCQPASCAHAWDKWEVIERGSICTRELWDIRYIGQYIIQQRECILCGLAQLNKQEVFRS